MLIVPKRSSKTRWLTIALGIVIFLWLSPEDNHIWPAVVLGILASTLIVLLWTLGRLGGKQIVASQIPVMATMLGAIIGIGSSLMTALLMLLKNARHSHFFPDFPPGQIVAIIERAPVWALAGGLIGLGLGLLWNGLKNRTRTDF